MCQRATLIAIAEHADAPVIIATISNRVGHA